MMNYLTGKIKDNMLGFSIYIIVTIVLKVAGVTILNWAIGGGSILLGIILFVPVLGLIPALFIKGDYEGSDSSVSILLWSILLVFIGFFLI